MRVLMPLAVAGAVLLTATHPASSQNWRRGYDDDFATEYCRYYKTRAYYARRHERAGKYARSKHKRARYLWAQYVACLEKYGTANTEIPRW